MFCFERGLAGQADENLALNVSDRPIFFRVLFRVFRVIRGLSF